MTQKRCLSARRFLVPLLCLLTGFGALFASGARNISQLSADVSPASTQVHGAPPSSAFLSLLPEGEAKRKFILDCTGCHVFDARIAFPGGNPRSQQSWEDVTRRMIGYAGAHTPFPVIAGDRDPVATAAWLSAHVKTPPEPLSEGKTLRERVTEFVVPEATDLPHDLMVAPDGKVVITGMMSNKMWLLDPRTGGSGEERIPVERANPRALDLGRDGSWWVLLGGPKKIAHFNPGTREWKSHEIGMYPHSIQKDAQGRIWFNGHFTKDPELIGYLDPASGNVRTYAVPNTPELREGAGPIPYDLRVAPDGSVWGTELHGNRIFRFDPKTERFETYTLPTPHSGPRRADFDAQGNFWIAEYAANKLARFDPKTKKFREYTLPIPDALPYITRVDQKTGVVWIGTGAADALVGFDPRTEKFTVYELPTRGALIRHIDIDPRNGDVWAAYGAAPGIPAKIALLRVGH